MRLDVSTRDGGDVASALRGPDHLEELGAVDAKTLTTVVLRHFCGFSSMVGLAFRPDEITELYGATILDDKFVHKERFKQVAEFFHNYPHYKCHIRWGFAGMRRILRAARLTDKLNELDEYTKWLRNVVGLTWL